MVHVGDQTIGGLHSEGEASRPFCDDIRPTYAVVHATLGIAMLLSTAAAAQDVPGIEICTVDKTMERRTSCLQSNVDFLVKTINKLRGDHDQKLDAANRQIAALKIGLADLQKALAELQSAKPVAAPPAVKDAPAAKADPK